MKKKTFEELAQEQLDLVKELRRERDYYRKLIIDVNNKALKKDFEDIAYMTRL